MPTSIHYNLHNSSSTADAVISRVLTDIEAFPLATFAKVKLPSVVTIDVAVVSSDKMKKLNKQYRQLDSSTDILSFYYGEDELVGELYLSMEDIKLNAVEFSQNDLAAELAEMIIHGTLHLFGFDHSDEMFAIQRKYARLWYENNRGTGKSRS